jgi:radical SAM superfamily enzyme YgiQ (UPF0313 family)
MLLVNPGYPETFWSFNKVLRMVGKKVVCPPLGLITVAALLPQDWEFRLVELTARDLTEDDWNYCDVLMVTGMVNQSSGMMQTIKEGKRRGKIVVVGGPLVFHLPDSDLKPWADFIVRGEAEVTTPALVDALRRGDKGGVFSAETRADISLSPAPRYDLLDLNIYTDSALQFSRGCPFHCEFCDITLMFGREVRTKTPAQVLKELGILYELGWRGAVFFVDDNFVGNPVRTKALLRALVPWMEEHSYPFDFYTQVSVNLAGDPELLDLMVRAGFFCVFLGIETTDRESLEQAKKYQNVHVDLDKVCERINRAGLEIMAGCILGFDGEATGAGQRLVDFGSRNQIPEMFVTLLQAGPGTDLWKRLEREGRLLDMGMQDDFGSQTGTMNFIPTRPKEEIVTEFIQLYEQMYEPGAFLERVFHHMSRMDPLPYKKRNFFESLFEYKKDNFLESLFEMRALLTVLFRQGIVYPSRLKFWRFLFLGMLRFRPRMRSFLTYCVKCEHYYEFRNTIGRQLGTPVENKPPKIVG